jgi:hypothetical protein
LLSLSIADRIEKGSFTMMISSWLSWPISHSGAQRGQRPNPVSRRKKACFSLEPLEGRALLTSYTAAGVSDLIADITAANTSGGANTITLTAPTTSPYTLTAQNNSSYAGGANGLPVIAANDNLTIVGNGDTIQRTARESPKTVFRLFDVAPNASLTLQNLSLRGGMASWNTVEGSSGGAIYNLGTLTLSKVTVWQEQAGATLAFETEGMGGGIWSNGSLILENGTLLEINEVTGAQNTPALGGGVYIAGGTASITSTTFTSNSVRSTGAGENSFGGALYVAAGKVNVTNTTVNGNTAVDGKGAGLYVAGGTVTLIDDTVESNTDALYGGGLYVAGGTVTLTSDTVESNAAEGDGGGIYIASGATVYVDPFTVANTINNTDSSGLNGPTANIDGTYTLS